MHKTYGGVMKKQFLMCSFAFLILTIAPTAKSAITIIDLQGDKDGFGVGCPIASGLNYLDYGQYWNDYRKPGDPDFTDYWYEGDKSWSHSYDLLGLTPISATLEIFIAGIADYDGWTADVRVDGVIVGTIPSLDGEHDLTRLLTFNIPVGLINNWEDVIIDVSDGGDAYIVDYSELSINAIPAPGALLLCGIGVSFLSWLRRRQTL
jgi:hypothetical protein